MNPVPRQPAAAKVRAKDYNGATMEPARELGKWLVVFGVVLAAAGALLLAGGKLPLRWGRLPGDVVYHGRHTTFYFPIVTCIVLSVVLTAVFWLVSLFRR